MYTIEPRMQICLRNPRIADIIDHVSKIQLIKLKYKFKHRDNIETTVPLILGKLQMSIKKIIAEVDKLKSFLLYRVPCL
jgi:hypothetical protein